MEEEEGLNKPELTCLTRWGSFARGAQWLLANLQRARAAMLQRADERSPEKWAELSQQLCNSSIVLKIAAIAGEARMRGMGISDSDMYVSD